MSATSTQLGDQDMDYFQAAFDGFDPQGDEDAALKFCLDAIFADHRLNDLGTMLSPQSGVGGLEGEPGWILERRLDNDDAGYEGWPPTARFRSFVEPENYSLGRPEFFCDAMTFQTYAIVILKVFAERHPEKSEHTRSLESLLEKL